MDNNHPVKTIVSIKIQLFKKWSLSNATTLEYYTEKCTLEIFNKSHSKHILFEHLKTDKTRYSSLFKVTAYDDDNPKTFIICNAES